MYEIVFSLVSVLVSIISAAVSAFYAQRSRRDTQSQQRLQAFALQQEYLANIRVWADESIEALTQAIFLCDLEPARMPQDEFFGRWLDVRMRLSTLTDRGRLFFENEKQDDHGQHKPPAFRGYRSPSLDPLLAAYRLIDPLRTSKELDRPALRDQLTTQRRTFVSNIQALPSPRQRQRELDGMLS